MQLVHPVLVGAAAILLAGAALVPQAAHPSRAPRPTTLYAIGDSWSAGLHADPERTLVQDAAEDLGITSIVDAESGTGYLTAPGSTATYVDRAKAIPPGTRAGIALLQGGSNDGGADLTRLPAAVASSVAAVRRALPRATVVLLGPGPDPWPITGRQRRVDAVLAAEARALGVRYVSPFREGWFTAGNIDRVIDPATHHPTVRGDEYLGARLAHDLAPLAPRRADTAR